MADSNYLAKIRILYFNSQNNPVGGTRFRETTTPKLVAQDGAHHLWVASPLSWFILPAKYVASRLFRGALAMTADHTRCNKMLEVY